MRRRGADEVAAYLDEMVSGDFLLLFHCISSIYSLRAFQRPSVPLWPCLWALKERPHLTSISTGVLKTHGCNVINHDDSGNKVKLNSLEIIADLMATQERWALDPYRYQTCKNRAGSRKWAKVGRGRALTKAALHTHTHSHTIKYSPRKYQLCRSLF